MPGESQAVARSALTASADGTTSVRSALLGEQADLYTTTRTITGVVNGGTYAVLTLVRTIVEFPAHHRHRRQRRLGTAFRTSEPQRLAPDGQRASRRTAMTTSWRVVPSRRADTAFISILSGHHNAVVMGAAKARLSTAWAPAPSPSTGTRRRPCPSTTRSSARPTSPTRAPASAQHRDHRRGVHRRQGRRQTGEIHDAVYQYAATPGAGGDFQYASHRDALPGPGPTGSARELFTIHSRWLETGAGRSDVRSPAATRRRPRRPSTSAGTSTSRAPSGTPATTRPRPGAGIELRVHAGVFTSLPHGNLTLNCRWRSRRGIADRCIDGSAADSGRRCASCIRGTAAACTGAAPIC